MPFTSSPPMWKYWSGKSLAISAMKFVQKLVRFFVRGIHRRIEHAPLAFQLVGAWAAGEFRIADKPRGAVTGHIKFRHDANAAVARIGNQVADFFLGVKLAVGTLFLQLRKFLALHAKAFVVRKVPVKHVQFHGFHAVQIALQHRQRNEMARDIDHQATPLGIAVDPEC